MPQLLAVLTAALLVSGSAACSSFMFKCSTTGDIPISGHTFDHGANLGFSLVALPRGYTYQALQVCTECAPVNYTFPLAQAYLAVSLPGAWGYPVQGLNERGLAVGAHTTDPDTAAVAPYQPDGPPTAIAWPDLMPFLLGNFETVGEAVDFLDAQEVQITTELTQPAAVDGMSRFGTRVSSSDGSTLMSIPLHISMYDASGDGALIEWYGDKDWVIYRNVSVVTNLPAYPQHLKNLEKWLELRKNITDETAELLEGGLEGLYPAYPGGIASASRFVRMSILVDQVCTFAPSPWPSDTNWSPGFAGAQDFLGRTALAQADGIIRTVDIVRGLQPEFLGLTQVSVLRDHANRMMYYKTPLTARWQGINLTTIAEEYAEATVLPLFANEQLAFPDVTEQLEPIPVHLGVLTSEEQSLLNPLINNLPV